MSRSWNSRGRWLVPVAAVGVSALVGAVPHLVSSATADAPKLAPVTPTQLIDQVRTTQVRALSGDISVTANLGLPSLGALGALGGSSSSTTVASLLSGTHTARVWVDGPEHLRVATLAPMAETDWIRNGADLWSYDSSTLTTTHATVPTHSARGDGATEGTTVDSVTTTPQDLAQQLLDKITPSTQVSVDSTGRVAGRDVYRLVLAPDDVHSTIGRVVISVDATTGLPLDVAVTTRADGATALEVGFTHIDYATPAPSEFAFTPPPGSTVVQASSPSAMLSAGGRTDAPTQHRHRHHLSGGFNPALVPSSPTTTTASVPLDPKVLGHDWTSVLYVDDPSVANQIAALVASAPSVDVGGVSAKMLSTSLVNVLILPDGHLAVGAVDTATLAALAANP